MQTRRNKKQYVVGETSLTIYVL